MKDTQKQKLYKSEFESVRVGEQQEFKTVAECQKYINKLLAKKSIINKFGKFEITVTDGRGRRSAGARTGYGNELSILLPKWSRNRYVIIHELAHHLQKSYGSDNWQNKVKIGQAEIAYQSHGARFVATLLWLVKYELGQTVHDQLSARFNLNGVKTLDNGRVVSISLPQSQRALKESA